MTLQNLTVHEIVLDLRPNPEPGCAEPPEPPPRVVNLEPAGAIARVVEPVAGEGELRTRQGVVHEVRLRRSAAVEGLPPERPGVVYVVPRLTAWAARHRADLVFPHLERRDRRQRVVGARALGRFEPERRRRRHSVGEGRRVPPARYWHDVQAITLALGVVFTVAIALLGGALGVVPDLVAGDPKAPDFVPRLLTGAAVLVGGVSVLWGGLRLWQRRETLRRLRGTAYVIDELAEAWTYEEKRSFLADLRTEFAAVLRVPGPADLGAEWRWPLGVGAERWSDKVDELAKAFWAVHFNDDQVTHNALFVWAWWPVALAFAARATAGRRRMTLRVRHRPSSGREGQLDAVGWQKGAHVFLRDPSPALRRPAAEQPVRAARITLPARTPAPSFAAAADSSVVAPLPAAPEETAPVTVLLVRMSRGEWGPIPDVSSTPREPIELAIADSAGLGLAGPVPAQVREWRCLAKPGQFHDWDSYPGLAQAAVDWIASTAARVGGIVLLGMLVPQEVAVGMGVLIAHAPQRHWPAHLWPVHFGVVDGRRELVIPGLDLGWRSLQTVHRG